MKSSNVDLSSLTAAQLKSEVAALVSSIREAGGGEPDSILVPDNPKMRALIDELGAVIDADAACKPGYLVIDLGSVLESPVSADVKRPLLSDAQLDTAALAAKIRLLGVAAKKGASATQSASAGLRQLSTNMANMDRPLMTDLDSDVAPPPGFVFCASPSCGAQLARGRKVRKCRQCRGVR